MHKNPHSHYKVISNLFSLFLVIIFQCQEVQATIRLAGVFGDNMVLQRDKAIRLWGWAKPGASIRIGFLGKTYYSPASAQGKWLVSFDPAAAGGPYQVTIDDGEETLLVNNVLIGEVWLCGGQSNMVLDFNSPSVKARYLQEIAASANDQIRQVVVNRVYSSFPAEDCKTSGWKIATPQTLPAFSATAYFFAKELFERYHIPVGLVNDCYGGTLCEAWTGETGLSSLSQFTAGGILLKDTIVLHHKIQDARTAADNWDQLLDRMDTKTTAGSWTVIGYDDSKWNTIKAPDYWDRHGYKDSYGSFWFRKEIDLSSGWLSQNASLNIGQLDDADLTYFNGVEVGKGNNRDLKRQYAIPSSLIKAGKNVIAIRIVNYNGTGGMNPESRLSITNTQDSLSLNGEWKFRAGAMMPVKPNLFDPKNLPSSLYNGMVAPLAELQFRGIIWYQGEFNARRAYEYRELFPAMIRNWRKTFHNDQLPFLFVQLPNFQPVADHPVENDWAELREAQSMALALPNTGMAVTIDVGGPDLHPAEKKPVGQRLSLLARKLVYGEKKLVASGPLFRKMKIKKDRIILKFDNGGSPLVAKDGGELRYFAIAGENRKFVWATAVIRNNTIEVFSKDVMHPVAVRYAWAGNPAVCNLYNVAGLPASPFRTDDWPGITINNH